MWQAGSAPSIVSRSEVDEVRVEFGSEAVHYELEPVSGPGDLGPIDDVWLAVKAHQTAATAATLTRLSPGRVFVLQNGVEHIERLRPIVGEGVDLVPVVVRIPATRRGTGGGDATSDRSDWTRLRPDGHSPQRIVHRSPIDRRLGHGCVAQADSQRTVRRPRGTSKNRERRTVQ
jgi:ketopantoate reductase